MFQLLNKEKGITSFKAINQFARANNIKKIGHTGTLDPLATGLLLVATGDDTKLIQYVEHDKKEYIVDFVFGFETDTLDVTGVTTQECEPITSIDLIKKTIMSFVKTYDQIPPNFSAKKVNGKRAYDLARANVQFELKPKTITIHSISDIEIAENKISFKTMVSNGTYIRSLIRDIGYSLNNLATMTELKRNSLSEYLSFDKVGLPLDETKVLKGNFINVSMDNINVLLQGKTIKCKENDGEFLVLLNNNVVGFCQVNKKIMKSKKLLGNKIERIINESN